MALVPEDFDDVLVTVAHPWAEIETTLRQWIQTGPAPRPVLSGPGVARVLPGLRIFLRSCSSTRCPTAGNPAGLAKSGNDPLLV